MTPMPQCLDTNIMAARQELLAKDYLTPPQKTKLLCRSTSASPIFLPPDWQGWQKLNIHAYGLQEHREGPYPFFVWQDNTDPTKYTIEAVDHAGSSCKTLYMPAYSQNTLNTFIQNYRLYPLLSVWDYHTMHLDDWAWWHTLDRTRCFYCARLSGYLETDHMDPKALAGSPRRCNKAPACRPCNEEKSDTPLHDWLTTIHARQQKP